MPKWPRPKAGPDVNGGEHLYELPLHVRVSEELPVPKGMSCLYT